MKLVNYLLKNRLKQKEFVKSVGISESYLSLLLRGKRTPSVPVALQIERATSGEVTALELLGLHKTTHNR